MDAEVRIFKRSEDPFARVPNALLADERLSWKAKGIAAYLLGKPTNWIVRVKDLINRGTDGRHAVYAALRELRDAGYLQREESRRENGTIEVVTYRLADTPMFSGVTPSNDQLSGFQEAGNQEAGNQPHTKKEALQRTNHSNGECLSLPQVCEFLLPMFGIPAGDFLKLGGEVQHQVGLAKITREEADALLRFYRLPHDSKYPEVKSRKQKLSRFMPEYREQIALALKICGPRKRHVPRGTSEANTVGANLRPPEPTSEPEREAIVQRVRASLAELRQRLGRGGSVANGAQNGDIDAGRPAVDTAGDSTIHQ